MKTVIYTMMLAAITTSAGAQTLARNFMVGGNIMSTAVSIQDDNTGYELALQPKVGYFINENLVLGLALELGVNALKSNVTMNYGITPFARVFVGRKSVDGIPKTVMFFLEAGGGFGGRNSRFEIADGTTTTVTTNGAIFYAGPGVDIFLNRNVAFELGAEYRHIGGSPDVNRVGLNLGFQIFLSKAEGKGVYKDTKFDMGMNDTDQAQF